MIWTFETSKSTSLKKKSDTSSNKAIPPSPSRTVPPSGDQVIKTYEPMGNVLIQITILKFNHFELEVSCGFKKNVYVEAHIEIFISQ